MKKVLQELPLPRDSHSPLPEESKSAFRQSVAGKLVTAGRSAFTLVELLIVITVIGILAALLLPAISRSKYKAQQIQCVGNLHQLGVALQTFVADNHAYPSIKANTNSDNPGMWQSQLELGGFGISKPFADFVTEGVWRCPSARWRSGPGLTVSYGYNTSGVLRLEISFCGHERFGAGSLESRSPTAPGQTLRLIRLLLAGPSEASSLKVSRRFQVRRAYASQLPMLPFSDRRGVWV